MKTVNQGLTPAAKVAIISGGLKVESVEPMYESGDEFLKRLGLPSLIPEEEVIGAKGMAPFDRIEIFYNQNPMRVVFYQGDLPFFFVEAVKATHEEDKLTIADIDGRHEVQMKEV
jgi:hypothetical protein